MMNKTIWKFPLYPIEETMYIEMPHNSEILCVQMQVNEPYIWAIVDNDTSYERRILYIRGTGHDFNGSEGKYIGTFQLSGGLLVFHVFEDINVRA